MSVREQIESKIKYAPKGKLFILSDFSQIADYNSVKINVQNLVKAGILEKVYSGIYMKPNYAEFLGINLPPDIYELVRTYARKFNWTITPSGSTALNMLGLDTQVPAKMSFISTGPTRKIEVNGMTVQFLHRVLRDSNYSEPTALLIEALKSYRKAHGDESISDEVLKTINQRFTDVQFRKIEKEAVVTRAWIKDALTRMKKLRVEDAA
jgi:hypothetical protein